MASKSGFRINGLFPPLRIESRIYFLFHYKRGIARTAIRAGSNNKQSVGCVFQDQHSRLEIHAALILDPHRIIQPLLRKPGAVFLQPVLVCPFSEKNDPVP